MSSMPRSCSAVSGGRPAAASLPPLTAGQLRGIEDIYDRRIRAQVHDRW